MKPNIGLAGSMYAGKSTIASALTAHGYQPMSFANPLKNVAALAYGPIDKSANYMTTHREQRGVYPIKSGRQILQEVGQTLKAVDRDFWLRCFSREAARYEGPLVVDDLRFWFEMEHLVSMGWVIVGVNTPLEVRMERAERIMGRRPTEAEMSHQSEIEVPRIIAAADLTVTGNGDPYAEAQRIIDAYKSSGR